MQVHGVFFAVLVVLVGTAQLDGMPRRVAVLTSSALPAALLLVQLVRRRIPRPAPWWIVVLGLLILTFHNVRSLIEVGILGAPAVTGIGPRITLPVAYLAMLVAAAIVAFPFAQRDVGGVIDGVVVAIGCASVLWALVLQPTLVQRGAGIGDLAYELIVLLLVSAIAGSVVRALMISRRARPVLMYLLLAVVMTMSGNVVGGMLRDPVTGAQPWWIAILWITGYLALGAGALHPANVHLGDPDVRTAGRLTPSRFVFLGLVLGLNPVLAGLTALTGGEVDWLLLSAGTVALVPLVLLRIAQLTMLHARAEQRLSLLVAYDELTGLPNRRTLNDHLDRTLASVAQGDADGVVVSFLDLDDFKIVNDEHGHSVGDALLIEVGRRLTGALRADDLVARFGGDEFVLVCTGDPAKVEPRVREAVAQATAEPVELGTTTLTCRTSIGCAAVGSGSVTTRDQVLSLADADMYDAKARTKGSVRDRRARPRLQQPV
ncbi:GGDEF domain-containing protein [Cellulomonas bogoriensis]|uniref:GGDEF domain-containing protein n=1 Tax=Cellulomonas bogoriensis 69B4 = DSM 16987 TaxID=1386082 RepID=A0A0A0BYM7_9CELL|nr:GGDEF domain-containing protein [Cellulomonas bogoriensis]KGM13075.1 hypothetical protein N869_12405 [Cellulomonas bogoriensis 69B4 = DSM 16987]